MGYKICIIGSGINGLACALNLGQQFYDCHLTILAAEFPPNTTSDHGFGIVMNSIKSSSFRNQDTDNFVQLTVEYCKQMNSLIAKEAGIQFVKTTFLAYEKDQARRDYSQNITNGAREFRVLSQGEMKKRGYVIENRKLERIFKGPLCRSECLIAYEGHWVAIDTSIYLPWLIEQLQNLTDNTGKRRVLFLQQKVSNFNELGEYDLIVNCSGLGARDLANDNLVVPIRGQYLQVDMPVESCFFSEGGSIVPRFNDLCLGAIKQIGRWDLDVDPKDTEKILRVSEFTLPRVREAKILKVGVALRPGRVGGTRVELQESTTDGLPPIIHNYGHGAGGISQHWGCALKVVNLALKALAPISRL